MTGPRHVTCRQGACVLVRVRPKGPRRPGVVATWPPPRSSRGGHVSRSAAAGCRANCASPACRCKRGCLVLVGSGGAFTCGGRQHGRPHDHVVAVRRGHPGLCAGAGLAAVHPSLNHVRKACNCTSNARASQRLHRSCLCCPWPVSQSQRDAGTETIATYMKSIFIVSPLQGLAGCTPR